MPPQPPSSAATPPHLSHEYIRSIAKLSRLALTDSQITDCQAKLSSTLGYVERISQLDLASVEPLTAVSEQTNQFRADEPGPMLANRTFMHLAPKPQSSPPFLTVPKVLNEGGPGDG